MSWEVNFLQPPLWSAVIPTYGEVGVGLTTGLLESLDHNSDFAHELIVVDDGSDGNVAQRLEDLCEKYRANFIHLEENMGFAFACNRGMEQANGRVVILTNNDIRPIGPTLDSLADTCLSYSTVFPVGLAGCKLLYPDATVQHAGVFYHPDRPFDHYCRHAPRYAPEARLQVINGRLLSGALLAIHRNTILTIGLLDEHFGCAGEDIDYNLACLESGQAIIYNGLIEAFHLEGKTRGNTLETKSQFPEWVEREERGLQYLFEKWYGFIFDQFSQQRLFG